jgi:hypothetical protein
VLAALLPPTAVLFLGYVLMWVFKGLSAMNWRRGLFRLRLVLSLCWTVPVVVLERDDLTSRVVTKDLTKWSDEALLKAHRGDTLSLSDYPADWPRRLAVGGIIIGPPSLRSYSATSCCG